jgi:hypothetical protein
LLAWFLASWGLMRSVVTFALGGLAMVVGYGAYRQWIYTDGSATSADLANALQAVDLRASERREFDAWVAEAERTGKMEMDRLEAT